jgi:hypothetical protein
MNAGALTLLARMADAAAPPQLELRDIHLPPPPSWWPPAPGWWVLAILVVAASIWLTRVLLRQRRERLRLHRLRATFDAAASLQDPRARIAAISELLRRAARLTDASAGQLEGEAWLGYLDATLPHTTQPFSAGPGRLLLDGAYRREVDDQAADAVWAPARESYLRLIGARR